MVLQQRHNDSTVFHNRTFEEYALGFGDQQTNFWLGLEKIRAILMMNKSLELKMEIWGDRCDKKAKDFYLVGNYKFNVSFFFCLLY